jgi:hypothetical protein
VSKATQIAIDEVGVGFVFEVFAAVRELTTQGFGEEELGCVAESFFGVVCLKYCVKLQIIESESDTYLVMANGALSFTVARGSLIRYGSPFLGI